MLSALAEKRLKKLADFMERQNPRHFNMGCYYRGKANRIPSAGTGEPATPEALTKGLRAPTHCGTTACALGFATMIPEFHKRGLHMVIDTYGHGEVLYAGMTFDDAAMEFFDITDSQSEQLFGYRSSSEVHDHLNPTGVEGAIYRLDRLVPGWALLISTSAPRVDYRWIHEVSQDIPEVGLQFSVHESTDARRDKLIPFERKLALFEIALEGEAWHRSTGRQPFFNYCAHEGNVTDEDAHRLEMLFKPDVWQATISVVCERDESVAAANARQRQLATEFQAKLAQRGFSTRCFDPAGQDDIGGGCGQLWFVQDWMHRNPTLARPSIGRQYPKIHAPLLQAA